MGDDQAIGWVGQVQENLAPMPLYADDWLVSGLIVGFLCSQLFFPIGMAFWEACLRLSSCRTKMR